MAVEAYGKENRQEGKKPSRPPIHTPSQLEPYTCLLTLEPSGPDYFP